MAVKCGISYDVAGIGPEGRRMRDLNIRRKLRRCRRLRFPGALLAARHP
jgi:hypothetical protein